MSQYEKNKQAAKQPQKAQAKAEKREPVNKKAEAPKKAATKKEPNQPAVVGAFVKVTGGDHEGRYGVLMEGPEPSIVRTRDSANERIVVAYEDLAPAESGLR